MIPESDRTTAAVMRVDRWIEHVVIELGLCPFAAAVRRRGLLRYRVVDTARAARVIDATLDTGRAMLDGDEPELTTMLLLTRGFDAFDRYLSLVARVERALSRDGFDGHLQVASFHPDYRFADAPADDPAHYTNRSPLPLLHLLQEEAVGRAVDAYPDPETIPDRNVQRLRALGIDGVRALTAGAQPVQAASARSCASHSR